MAFPWAIAALAAAAGGGLASAFGKKDTKINKGYSISSSQKKLFEALTNKAQAGLNQGAYRPYPGATTRLGPTGNEQAIFDKLPQLLARIGGGQGGMNQAMQTASRPPNPQGAQPQAPGQTPGAEEEPTIAEIIHKGQTNIISKILKAVSVGR